MASIWTPVLVFFLTIYMWVRGLIFRARALAAKASTKAPAPAPARLIGSITLSPSSRVKLGQALQKIRANNGLTMIGLYTSIVLLILGVVIWNCYVLIQKRRIDESKIVNVDEEAPFRGSENENEVPLPLPDPEFDEIELEEM